MTVFEARSEAGGQFLMAGRVPGKEAYGDAVAHRVRELAELGVELRLGRRIGWGDLAELRGFDGAVLASGVLPRRPAIPGTALDHVVDYQQALADPAALGERVVVIGGGGIAVDVAHLLTSPQEKGGVERFFAEYGIGEAGLGAPAGPVRPARAARRVTVVRRSGRVGAGIGASTKWVQLAALRARGVETVTGVGYREITAEGVVVVDAASGTERLLPADSVVVAAGQEPQLAATEVLEAAGIPFRVAGGAASTERLNAVRATTEGIEAAYALTAGGG
ncbi:FAD-dependent oxidoreductase [Phaeacidiphilus oryzae]|uniref:FAD-dependent oxidoreductase n=1 Tax=Phaeacidiphilus oryzae TaxID=348818 RepID=UPI00055C6FBE|nr:FAD-dependent oxidoreductase [Phaeacidiphilus oryzae]